MLLQRYCGRTTRMSEPNMISDVRAAKAWVDAQAGTLEEMVRWLQAVERDFERRSGVFATVPDERPESVRQAIEAAPVDPGRELLGDARPGRD